LSRRLVPFAVGGQQGILVLGQLITREKRDVIIRHMRDPRQQQVRIGLVPLADHESQYETPHWRKRNPHPSVPVGRAIELGAGQMRFLGVDETPSLVELAFPHVQVVPQGEHDHATVACDTIEPGTNCILVYLDDPRRGTQRIAFR
jgi:hypothetical protein